jgi:hypothetical protein
MASICPGVSPIDSHKSTAARKAGYVGRHGSGRGGGDTITTALSVISSTAKQRIIIVTKILTDLLSD